MVFDLIGDIVLSALPLSSKRVMRKIALPLAVFIFSGFCVYAIFKGFAM